MTFKKIIPSCALALGLAVLGTGSRSEAAETPATSAYQQAVQSYVKAASTETGALRTQLHTLRQRLPAGAKEPAVEAAETVIAQCERLIEQLGQAGPGRFDTLKGEYERQRTAARQALADALMAHPETPAKTAPAAGGR